MKRGIAISSPVQRAAATHLLRPDGQEDLCFALWNPSVGVERETALIERIILPIQGERRVHGNASFLPAYFERCISLAREQNCGLALMHSHPAPGWQGMSPDDVDAERGNAAATLGATGLPLVGLTIGTDEAWSARFWLREGPRKYGRHWCESVRVVGDRLITTYHQGLRPEPRVQEEQTRTTSVWGHAAQADLARLRVGVVGAGSVGAIVAEALARMGIADVGLFDFDVVERINLDRLLSAVKDDADRQRAKVRVLAERLEASATAAPFLVRPFELSVVEESGFRAALDYDVLFSCVDRPWPRFVLNFIANAHLIPVIDGGIRLLTMPNGRGLKRGTWRAHVVGPTRRCLECLGQYEPCHVSLERSGMLEKPSYIEGLPKDHALRGNQNVFAFSLSAASLELEQFLRMVVPHPGHANIGAQTVNFVSGMVDADLRGCNSRCPFCSLVAKGDRSGISDITGLDRAAERTRQAQRDRAALSSAKTVRWLPAARARVKSMFRSVIKGFR